MFYTINLLEKRLYTFSAQSIIRITSLRRAASAETLGMRTASRRRSMNSCERESICLKAPILAWTELQRKLTNKRPQATFLRSRCFEAEIKLERAQANTWLGNTRHKVECNRKNCQFKE